ncbi:hypothetical protein PHYSODRAFT_319655 [Phytophthora sojae]|uniref:Erythromycin biosynthesis protein CIII-like C-terminal domain-containing protein n=1 Tax=Phytophthora sojae (strain P6497) TaxID=1094619 RepID=G5ACM9_PHYSP|nr:hypothetical protein PHYSODRAFT_319655 [Phytophthora sojae]EGZ07103.1 hypothetical protein PHYSODRAFT_319655 [Phytophthora sojae]|eukprot:XP_009537867.1 hypothetical protein PHYSODRAFT_319655 [Phytophthora sojae]
MKHGVEFYPLGGDPKKLAAYMVKTGGHLIPLSLEAIQKDVPRNMQMIEEILNSTWPAVSEADPDGAGPGKPGKPFRAQGIIANPVSYGHIHVAERLVPTTAFPHPLANMEYSGKPKRANYLSYKLVDLLMRQGTESSVNAFRTDKLGLQKIRKGDGGRDILLDLSIPHTFMWSSHLVPKPNDWGKIYDVIGTVTLDDSSSSYTPSPELEAFLGGVTKMIIEAAEQANARVLIQSSWSDMAGDLEIPSNVFFIGNCPHGWLMPRVSAVVHHGGAGTTAAGLLGGKPTFIVPFFGDQPFWGRAVLDAGVGVEPCPISQLTTSKLRAAFEALGSAELRQRALELRDLMRQEDGAGEAVRCFYRNLPLNHMRCDLNCVVTSRPENSQGDIVEYTYVDYSARGPDGVLEGASSGVGALAHVFGSGVKDVFVKPAQGYRQEGAKGAVIGLVNGLGGLMISPLVGTMVFADHVATGAYNSSREKNKRKKGSLISGNNKVLDALGFKSRNVHNGSMSADEEVEGEQPLSRQIAVELTPEERSTLEARFRALMKERELGPPRMNICMIVTGNREGSVQQYVAIGLRLQADGHCVRIATNNVHRDRVVNAGLAFSHLAAYIHRQAENKARRRSWLLDNVRHRDPFAEMKDLRELVFSLWPACVEADPLAPGKTFRADAIIAHPCVFGQAIVAERLGVSLHCMGDAPQSRTQAFPYLTSSSTDLHLPYRYSPANEASYDIVDKLVWNAMADILDEFRSSLGLMGRSSANNVLADWRIPFTYLWNPAVLPKPSDWSSEITVAGYNADLTAVDQALQAFAEEHTGIPLIHLRLTSSKWTPRQQQELIGTLELAAQSTNVRVVFQLHESSNASLSFSKSGNGLVFTVNQNFPVKRIFPHVHAAIHDGDLPFTSKCLAAGKPGCVVSRCSAQRALGQALEALGVGVKPLEADALILPNLLSPSSALERAVSAFYQNLPLAGMTYLDPTRIARVYDAVHGLKLSYEARLVVHQITGDSGSAGDLKYKPLMYSRHHPPKFSLRQLDGELLRLSSGGDAKKHKASVVYSHDPASDVGEGEERSTRRRRPSLLRGPSMALAVVVTPKFWSSPEEQAKCAAEVNVRRPASFI